MSLPLLDINIDNTIHGFEENGRLLYKYQPLQNLKIEVENGNIDLDDLRLPAHLANIDINTPISLDSEVSYDDSINIIVNDFENPLKIVNSRFYLVDSNNYKIADRRGNLDTNIYTVDNFKIEAGLVKSVRSVVSLDFLGLEDGGNMPIGSYNFYFKLADADGNETDFISESGKVVCHIGSINKPESIRGGQVDENSDKVIKFQLNDLDLAYDYIYVYYTRHTGDDKIETYTTHKITDKFKIKGVSTEVTITGYEEHEQLDNAEINLRYAFFDSAQTNENCQNIMFAGNVTKDYEIFKTLERLSLYITPSITTEKDIGNLNSKYIENYPKNGYEYYNANNIYYRLGYWDEEIYRFGIVYILNDYTLSPVFNIRGIKQLENNTVFQSFDLTTTINIGEDYLLENSFDSTNPENSKGIFKINNSDPVFNGSGAIKPIGLKMNFSSSVIDGDLTVGTPGLKDYTKGFFIVRQKRIPTLLTQAVGIATSTKSYFPLLKDTNGYFAESFLSDNSGKPFLEKDFFTVSDTVISQNALLCPEASVKPYIYNNFFNSSEFTLKTAKYSSQKVFLDTTGDGTVFSLGDLSYKESDVEIDSNLLLVEPGIEIINNGDVKFASNAGNSIEAWTHLDPVLGDINKLSSDLETDATWSNTVTKVRGQFNSYLGSSEDLVFGEYYNIFQKDYDFARWKNYFKVRYNDSSPFMAASDRISWDNIEDVAEVYRGDCYINTYTHRMNWNFIDPELPTNTRVVDPWNWYKNYRVKTTEVKVGGPNSDIVVDNTDGDYDSYGTVVASYKKVLPLFTYKSISFNADIDTADSVDLSTFKLTLPDSKKYKKYAEANGTFGTSSLNRADINGIPLGHWATFKICSNVNLAMRDIDFSRPEEEAVFGTKRKFHPFQKADSSSKLPESNILNQGLSKSLSDKYYYEVPDVPFIKDTFTTRIHYSNVLVDSAFKNGHRVFKAQNFQDYTLEHGKLVKLIDWYGKLVAVMEHGVLMIPVNERALVKNELGEDVYINTDTVLPKNPRELSNTYGSTWHDAIVKTPRFIYGLDTIGKKIWRTNGETFELISDLKVQRFLNDNIKLLSTDNKRESGNYSIKAHFNEFKSDVLFVFKYGEQEFNLCWNELISKWVTRYSWFPEFSENINNIFYTFANNVVHPNEGGLLFKHGFAGTLEEYGNIKPTKWYEEQHPFEFEFVVIGVQGVQKIYDNLKIISNKTAPAEFYFEVVGTGYDWEYHKENIYGFTTDQEFQDYLTANPDVKKLPYIMTLEDFTEIFHPNLRDITLTRDTKTEEKRVISYQKGHDMKANGRRLGNMEYVEDFWDIQIQPTAFKYVYLDGGSLALTSRKEMKVRDKYVKVRIKYTGDKYSIINAIETFFTLSYS